MKSVVIRFPGSNCERDSFTVLEQMGMNPEYVWHADAVLPEGTDLVIIPGGFTYGDYLRVGAMAAHAPIMQEIKAFAEAGGHVLGICNGFQILCEAGLLPGTLRRNHHLNFNCNVWPVRVAQNDNAFTSAYETGQVLEFPIAHHDGAYYADDETLAQLKANNQILFHYCNTQGEMHERRSNPNGSVQHIAGICNEKGNVLGLMPHPERAADVVTGLVDGLGVFESLKAKLASA